MLVNYFIACLFYKLLSEVEDEYTTFFDFCILIKDLYFLVYIYNTSVTTYLIKYFYFF